jgi:TRAP-type C4-dicarboxylate transport system permease large subunit
MKFSSKLFLAGIIPGILLAFALMITIYVVSAARNYPTDTRKSLMDFLIAFKDAFLPLLMPVIMIGGIVSGIFTPTEAEEEPAILKRKTCTINREIWA